MVRVRHSVSTHKRKKRVLKQAKGQFGQRSKRYQQAKRSLKKSMTYAYRDRRTKKREIKNLWIIRINAACREEGLPYSRFIKGLIDSRIRINRKLLADLAVNSPDVFKKLVQVAKDAKPLSPALPALKTDGSPKQADKPARPTIQVAGGPARKSAKTAKA